MDGLLQNMEAAARLCRKYGLSDEALTRGADAVRRFRVCVAVLGAFNTGKSALVNALAGAQLMDVSLCRETRVPVELFYGTQGVEVLRGGRVCRADPSALRGVGEALAGAQLARAGLPLPALEDTPGVSLLDTPGIGAHGADVQTAELAREAGAYILVFGADAPVITESMAAFLSTLPLKERPVLCVLTKCDLFSEAALGRMEEYLRESARRQLGLAGAQICRVYRAQGAPPAAQFVRAQAQRADALRGEQARRLLADGAAPLARYLAARVQNSRLLAPELARKAEVMDARLAKLHDTVRTLDERGAALVREGAEEGAAHSRDTLSPLTGPLADMIAAGQDPALYADGAVLCVVRAEARSRVFPVLEMYEKGMRRLASLYGLTLPETPPDLAQTAVDGAFGGTAALFAAAGAAGPQALADALCALVGRCLSEGGQAAFRALSETLSGPLYGQFDSQQKALEDTRREQSAEDEAHRHTLEELQADLEALAALTGAEGGADDAV